jgi:uncharacterized protein
MTWLDNKGEFTIFIFYPVSGSPMKISLDDITDSPKEISVSERIDDLNELYKNGQMREFHFPPFIGVHLDYYRSGQQIFFNGSLAGTFEATCSRCLSAHPFALNKEFELVLSPDPSQSGRKIEELRKEDLGLSYYSTEEINLTPLIREQVMLALPTRPLCKEDCRGLCDGCGVNLNYETCSCTTSAEDPRTAIFRTLKVGR